MPRAPHRIIVDGETFEILERADRPGEYDLDWVSGPNPGYGFSSATSDGSSLSTAHLEKQIRDFLAEVDPETGWLAPS